MKDIIVIGAGQAGASICAKLRQTGFNGKLSLFGDEKYLPYKGAHSEQLNTIATTPGIPTILPNLRESAMLEPTQIYSYLGKLKTYQ